MRVRRLIVPALALAGCAEPAPAPPLPLAEWRGVYVFADVHDGAADIKLTIWSATEDVDRALTADTTATVDGVAMVRQAVVDESDGPRPLPGPFFELDAVAERAGETSTIIIRDASATWTISVLDLATNGITLSAAPAIGSHVRATWPSAGGMNKTGDTVELYQDETYVWSPPRTPLTIGGQVELDIDLSAPPSWVQANALVIGSQRWQECDGPPECAFIQKATARFAFN